MGWQAGSRQSAGQVVHTTCIASMWCAVAEGPSLPMFAPSCCRTCCRPSGEANQHVFLAAATVAQGGVAAMALSAAASYAPKNIRVNCVAPGLTRTKMTERITSEGRALFMLCLSDECLARHPKLAIRVASGRLHLVLHTLPCLVAHGACCDFAAAVPAAHRCTRHTLLV